MKLDTFKFLGARRFSFLDIFSLAIFSALIEIERWPLAIVTLVLGAMASVWLDRHLAERGANHA